MSRPYASQLLLDIYPSVTLSRVTGLCGVLACISLFMVTSYSVTLSLLLCPFVVYVLLRAVRQNRFHQLQFNAKRGWLIRQAQGEEWASLLPGSVVSPFFTLLRFRTDAGAHRASVLLPDNIDAQTFRRLRVMLKVEGLPLADEFPRA